MILLRPHHLLCVLTYSGRGYSAAFTADFDRVAARIRDGEAVELVDGPDEVCRSLLADPAAHCHNASVVWRDARAVDEIGRLLGRPVAPGDRLSVDPGTIARLRSAFAAGTIRSGCIGCEWIDLCGEIAGQGFRSARIAPEG